MSTPLPNPRTPVPTKAQMMAAQYAESQSTGALVNPSDNPAWQNREKVPSSPRRDSAPQISLDGLDENKRETFRIDLPALAHPAAPGLAAAGFPDGASRAGTAIDPAEFLVGAAGALFVPEAVRQCPAWKAAGSQDVIDKRALEAAGQITYLVKQAPDQAMLYFRRVLSHPQTGILIFAQLDKGVKDELSTTFIRIALRKPWVFQVCRLLMSIRGHVAGPHLFRAVCALAAYHAFLAYADVISPFGHLEDAALQDNLTDEEQTQQDQEDSVLEKLLIDAKNSDRDDSIDSARAAQEVEDDPDDEADDEDDDEEKFLTEDEIAKLSVEELDELTTPDVPEVSGS